MAISKCSECGSTSFEITENSPTGANFKYCFIQCSNCGTVVSSTDFVNIPAELSTAKQEISKVQNTVRGLEDKINFLVSGMEQILRKQNE